MRILKKSSKFSFNKALQEYEHHRFLLEIVVALKKAG
jgi:hypothetical protein